MERIVTVNFINTRQVNKVVTLTVAIKRSTIWRYRARTWLGMRFIEFGVWIAGFGLKVEKEQWRS